MPSVCAVFLLAVSFAAAARAEQLCSFWRNGEDDGRHVVVDVADAGNRAALNASLVFVASELGLLGDTLPVEFELYTADGERVDDVARCARAPQQRLYVVRRGDLWVYPPGTLDDVRVVRAAGRKLQLRTLARRPRAFVVEDFLSLSECAELRRLSQLGQDRQLYKLDSHVVLSSSDNDIVADIEERLADLLRVPVAVVSLNAGLEVRLTRHQAASVGTLSLERDYVHANDQPPSPLRRYGVNHFVSVFIFLNTVATGGEINLPFAGVVNAPNYVYTHAETGRLQILVPPGLTACKSGSFARPREGAMMFVYNVEPDTQGAGEPDVLALFQSCNPVSHDRWLAKMRMLNKNTYDLSAVPVLGWLEQVLDSLLGVTIQQLLTNGYGWDYAEDVLGDDKATHARVDAEIARKLPGFFETKSA